MIQPLNNSNLLCKCCSNNVRKWRGYIRNITTNVQKSMDRDLLVFRIGVFNWLFFVCRKRWIFEQKNFTVGGDALNGLTSNNQVKCTEIVGIRNVGYLKHRSRDYRFFFVIISFSHEYSNLWITQCKLPNENGRMNDDVFVYICVLLRNCRPIRLHFEMHCYRFTHMHKYTSTYTHNHSLLLKWFTGYNTIN